MQNHSVPPKNIIFAEKPEDLKPLEGPIKWTVGGRNFILEAHRGEEIDPNDTSKLRDQAKHWGDLRLLYQWRKVVVFKNIDAIILGAEAALKVDPSQPTIDSIDDRLIQVHGEWLQLENSLVAYALKITELVDVNFIRSMPQLEKHKIIALQDRLNGHDMINHLREWENYYAQMRALQDQEENKAEERAALVEEAKKAAEARKLADAAEAEANAAKEAVNEPPSEPLQPEPPSRKLPKKTGRKW